ncbi:hypothetical protein HPG69_016854 [Diceros bicornis minor]|uniref:Uncharacterized protein n=1 Tax=Diceros bicornis minor TaxID=77932 RepID=A0A7J7EBX1_DICBM|nr:hypothetical protein HPG69_016854 [Diceros bicornis minor]
MSSSSRSSDVGASAGGLHNTVHTPSQIPAGGDKRPRLSDSSLVYVLTGRVHQRSGQSAKQESSRGWLSNLAQIGTSCQRPLGTRRLRPPEAKSRLQQGTMTSNIQNDISDAKIPHLAIYSFGLVQNHSKYLFDAETFVQGKFHLEALHEKQLTKSWIPSGTVPLYAALELSQGQKYGVLTHCGCVEPGSHPLHTGQWIPVFDGQNFKEPQEEQERHFRTNHGGSMDECGHEDEELKLYVVAL